MRRDVEKVVGIVGATGAFAAVVAFQLLKASNDGDALWPVIVFFGLAYLAALYFLLRDKPAP